MSDTAACPSCGRFPTPRSDLITFTEGKGRFMQSEAWLRLAGNDDLVAAARFMASILDRPPLSDKNAERIAMLVYLLARDLRERTVDPVESLDIDPLVDQPLDFDAGDPALIARLRSMLGGVFAR